MKLRKILHHVPLLVNLVKAYQKKQSSANKKHFQIQPDLSYFFCCQRNDKNYDNNFNFRQFWLELSKQRICVQPKKYQVGNLGRKNNVNRQ